jgi:hypothetical protein
MQFPNGFPFQNFPGMSPHFPNLPPGFQPMPPGFQPMPPGFQPMPPGFQPMPPEFQPPPMPQPPPIKTGSKQNLDKLMASKNIMENLLITAKKARLKEISKILLTDEDVVYLVSQGCQVTLLTECLESSETMKEQLGDINVITEPVSPTTIVLKPYRLDLDPPKTEDNVNTQ